MGLEEVTVMTVDVAMAGGSDGDDGRNDGDDGG